MARKSRTRDHGAGDQLAPFSIPLSRPLSFVRGGFPTVVTELLIRRPSRTEAAMLSNRVGLDQTFAMLALLSDIPVDAIEDLCARDFFAVCEVLAKF